MLRSCQLTMDLPTGPGTVSVTTLGLAGSLGMRVRDEKAREARAMREAPAGTADRRISRESGE